MREVAVIGVGSTIFGRFPERRLDELGAEALRQAMNDAGAKQSDIQFAYNSTLYGGMVIGQAILRECAITNIEVTNIENACAGGASAFRKAWYDIASGLYDVGIAIGIESITTSPIAGKLIPPAKGDLAGELGMNMVAKWALAQRRYMEEHGVSLEQIARVAVKNRHNGSLNPYSQYKKECTVEEVVNSRMICDPITLLQCCPNSDGAAAAILCSADMVQRFRGKPVKVLASVLKSGDYLYRSESIAFSEMTARSAKEAYEMAGLGPEDMDLCELHDPFAFTELAHCEELGFCKRGEGARLIEEGVTQIDGRLPVNPSGGLESKGHPVSATGVAQIAELVWQLRGRAGKIQVEGARVGMAHVLGGEVVELESGACSIHILGSW